MEMTMQLDSSTSDVDHRWLLLKSLSEQKPFFVGVIPEVPPESVRAAYPHKITIVVTYEADENGLPVFADDLEALNALEGDFREWDPEEQIFLFALRSTGLGRRRWVLYASDVGAMERLVPENDFLDIEAEHDPRWEEIASVLAGVRD